jgi:hypothetical protein
MMNPLLRTWAIVAALVAVLAMLRGAWALAFACFLFSPAPIWLFSSGGGRQGRWSLAWLGVLVVIVVASLALVLVAATTGGVPEVHEWRDALRASAR